MDIDSQIGRSSTTPPSLRKYYVRSAANHVNFVPFMPALSKILQVKWLSFMGAVLIELSARPASAPRAASIAKDLCPLLVEGLDHPFKACREEIGR